MANEELDLEQQQDQETDYVQMITEMRANTVSKDKYERVVEDNKKLMKALADGSQIDVIQAEEKPVDITQLRKELYTDEVQKLSDLDMIKKTLELRKAVMEAGGEDPFVPSGKRYAPEDSDYASAEKVADVFQQCVDYANGDNAVFLNELQRRTLDVSPLPSKRKR